MLAAAAAWNPADAQSGVEVFNGNWVGTEIVAADPNWPAMDAGAVVVAISGGNSEFEAEWTGLVLDDGALEWDESDADFERADRLGFFAPDDDPDIFDGEAQLWAYSGENGLVLGRLQIDDDSGRHVVYTCRLVRTEAGLDAMLTLTTSEIGAASAHVTMVHR